MLTAEAGRALMLLRRVTEHVHHQNWFAVWIDFVIVFVGVFVGIQAANWNDAQADKRLGQYYIDRLVADLSSDVEINAAQLSYYKQVLASIEQVERLFPENSTDAKTIVGAAYRATEVSNVPTNTATWEQIVSSGHVGLLRDPKLEYGLAEYYKYQQGTFSGNSQLFRSPYREAVRSTLPLSVQLAIREGCSDTLDEFNNAIRFVGSCSIKVDDHVLEAAAAAIRSSREVRETLRSQYSRVFSSTLNHEGNVAQAKKLLALLNEKQKP
ncbi:MAG: hypothetical protein AAGI72_18455 [Pseudomonadota bacterium]